MELTISHSIFIAYATNQKNVGSTSELYPSLNVHLVLLKLSAFSQILHLRLSLRIEDDCFYYGFVGSEAMNRVMLGITDRW